MKTTDSRILLFFLFIVLYMRVVMSYIILFVHLLDHIDKEYI